MKALVAGGPGVYEDHAARRSEPSNFQNVGMPTDEKVRSFALEGWQNVAVQTSW
jgi:hypothetical protein